MYFCKTRDPHFLTPRIVALGSRCLVSCPEKSTVAIGIEIFLLSEERWLVTEFR